MNTKNESLGRQRFEFFLSQAADLFNKGSKQKSPALWLYRSNLRTPFFMLEGLARLYADLHNGKRFKKLKERFKAVEDGLGAIDYFDAMSISFAANKKIPAAVVKTMKAQLVKAVHELDALLVAEGWLNGSRIAKIQEKLNSADWLTAAVEMPLVKKHYAAEIEEITDFVTDQHFHFDNMEEDVHELRRQLRWLSIYPQAMRGSIQLQLGKTNPQYLKKYLTKSITTSPYNKMPPKGKLKSVLLLDKNRFLALSWMIASLGEMKDAGLQIEALKHALQQAATVDDATAYRLAHDYLGSKQPNLLQLLDSAEKIAKTFFTEKNLAALVKGVST